MGWFDRIRIKFYLVRIYLKLLFTYLNPWSNLYFHPVVFFLARKAGRAALNEDETVAESDVFEQVSVLDSKKSET